MAKRKKVSTKEVLKLVEKALTIRDEFTKIEEKLNTEVDTKLFSKLDKQASRLDKDLSKTNSKLVKFGIEVY